MTRSLSGTTPQRRARADGFARQLERDQRLLSLQLSHIIQKLDDEALLDLVLELYNHTVARRRGNIEAGDRLEEKIARLDDGQLDGLVRALSCHLDLTNLAEDRHRIRVLRNRERASHPAPVDQTIHDAVESLATSGTSAEQMRALLSQLDVELVFTAHPTEAKRRTLRHALRRLRQDLIDLHHNDLLPRERDALLSRMRSDIGCVWETDTIRPRRPSVLDEVQRSLFLTTSLWNVVPRIYRAMNRALSAAYPDTPFDVPRFLRFGSWIGGDRDGHPYVTTDVTAKTLKLMREAAIKRHLDQCEQVTSVLSISLRLHETPSDIETAVKDARRRWPDVDQKIEKLNPWEIYRHWLTVIRHRLKHAFEAALHDDEQDDAAYRHADELVKDLQMIADHLRATGHDELVDERLDPWIDQARVFGFHTARLDVRQNSTILRQTVEAVLQQLGSNVSFEDMTEQEKQTLLTTPLEHDAVLKLREDELPDEAKETVSLFSMLHRVSHIYGREALGALVISMTHHASDVLCMHWLLRVGAIRAGQGDTPLALPVVPLFETIDDLKGAGRMLDTLLNSPTYREHLDTTGEPQICMIGYSDSIKDGGYLSANWQLYRAQSELASVAEHHGVKLTFFHGRGGALGRGGGPAARGILALPPHSVQGGMRITEQGEVLADRYDDQRIAERHLEQVISATMTVTAGVQAEPDPHWCQAMDRAANASLRAYQRLVKDRAFPEYFASATPIRGIEDLPIGSRPSRRSGRQHIDDLRAIPYTFAWVQNRHMITAFYGLGSGLSAVAKREVSLLQQMYEQWPFFRAILDTAELAATKADMDLAARYAALTSDPEAGQRVFSLTRQEYDKTVQMLIDITGHESLLNNIPWLAASIERRNPWVDALNFIQIEIMRRLSKSETASEETSDPLRELHRRCIQGIATGMRTTG